MKPATWIMWLFIVAITLVHLLRVVLSVPASAGGVQIPVWWSGVAVVVLGVLATLVWREQHHP